MFRIKYEDGSYFQYISDIGPVFGGTKAQAHAFDDKIEASRVLSSHFGFTMADVEEVKP